MTTALRPERTKAAAPPSPERPLGFMRRYWLPILVASLCNAVAVARVQYLAAFVAVACAAYLLLQTVSVRQAFKMGFVYMCGMAMLLNYWMVPVLLDYTGGNWLLTIGCYCASWLLMAPFIGAQFALFAALRRRGNTLSDHWRNALLLGAVWVVFEWLRAWVFSAIPFMSYAWGSASGQYSWMLQPAAFGGVFLLSFLLVVPAWFVALAAYRRQWRAMLPAAAIVLVQIATGYVLYSAAEDDAEDRPAIAVALAQPALNTDMTWDPQNGNALVQRLLALNRAANALRPQLIAWTETTVPWTYRADDDFLQVLAQSTKASGAYTLLGMSSDGSADDSLRSNSLYLLDSAGGLKGRYDKQELLAGAERPFLGGMLIPFQKGGNKGYRSGSGGPVPTPWGKAGLMLCNEATIPAQASKRAQAGASWLAVLGNDAWFENTYVAYGHFNQCRVRAVEIRKDLLVNINMGDAGVIRASGEVAARFDGTEAGVHSATIQPNNDNPPAHGAFNLFIIVALATCNRFFVNRKSTKKDN